MSAARILVAPDAFKGTYSAAEVAGAIARGIEQVEGATAIVLPIADGGEGTLEVLLEVLDAQARVLTVQDPLGRPVEASYGLSRDGRAAIVEMALASGLSLVSAGERDAWAASTFGTGELILAAARAGASEILVGVGGSATSDGGAGAVRAISEGGGLGEAQLVVLTDVTTPFEKAAEVYGAQKGARGGQISLLTARLHEVAEGYPRDPRGRPLTGAGGGLAGGLWAAFGATLIPGAQYVLDRMDFEGMLHGAAAVIVGEGQLDQQTLVGKAAAEVTYRAGQASVPVHAVVGRNTLGASDLEWLGLASVREARTLDGLAAAGRAVARVVVAGG